MIKAKHVHDLETLELIDSTQRHYLLCCEFLVLTWFTGEMLTIGESMNLTCKYMGYHYVNDTAYNVSIVLISVILSLLLIPALILNFAIAIAIVKENVLRTPAFFIIANMAVSDFLTNCTYLCFPVSSYYVIKGHDPCFITEKTTPLGYIFCLTSFLSIVLQSFERYLAIFYPFWYHEKFTTRMVIFLNLTSWVHSRNESIRRTAETKWRRI